MKNLITESRKNRAIAWTKELLAATALAGFARKLKKVVSKKDVWQKQSARSHAQCESSEFAIFPPRNHTLQNRICIMVSDLTEMHHAAMKAVDHFRNNCCLVDPFKDEWSIEGILARYDGVLYRPLFHANHLRQMSNEHMNLLRIAGVAVWPSAIENLLYEAKRLAAAYFSMHKIPHPFTKVFYSKQAALDFCRDCGFPLMLKTNTGASSSGVFYVRSVDEAVTWVSHFFDRGFVRRNSSLSDEEKGYVILQEFLPGVREYRVVQVGDSWFGHEKVGVGKSVFYSGSGQKSWDIPRSEVFDFCRDLSQTHQFSVMAYDVFETTSGELLLNEAQTWFGSYHASQMYRDGVPGRYRHVDNAWVFEEGYFNCNLSVNLRVHEFDRYLSVARQPSTETGRNTKLLSIDR